jgi:hypothetical protein
MHGVTSNPTIFDEAIAAGNRRKAQSLFAGKRNRSFVFQGGLQHVEPQHPPDEEQRDNGTRDMNDPVANCFRLAEIEHGGIVARGLNEAQEPLIDGRLQVVNRHLSPWREQESGVFCLIGPRTQRVTSAAVSAPISIRAGLSIRHSTGFVVEGMFSTEPALSVVEVWVPLSSIILVTSGQNGTD